MAKESGKVAYKKLFEPIQIGSVKIKNRFAYAPTNQVFHNWDGNTMNEEELAYYTARAMGGIGLMVYGAILSSEFALWRRPPTPATLSISTPRTAASRSAAPRSRAEPGRSDQDPGEARLLLRPHLSSGDRRLHGADGDPKGTAPAARPAEPAGRIHADAVPPRHPRDGPHQ